MFTKVEAPNYAFVVESSIPGTARVHERFVIEQFITNPRDSKERERITNQIEQHLHDLQKKTKLMYELVYWASPERVYGLYPECEKQDI